MGDGEALVGVPGPEDQPERLSPYGQPMDRATLRRQVALDMALERHKGLHTGDDTILDTARKFEEFLTGGA